MRRDDGQPGVRWWRRTVFWKLALLLTGVQIVTVVLAVGVSAYFAYGESLDLVENSLRLRLDGLAEELERRVPDLSTMAQGLPAPLVNDLATRFPDPIVLVGVEGEALRTVRPDPLLFGRQTSGARASLPPYLANDLSSGDVVIRLKSVDGQPAYAAAPLYDAAGFLAGGVVILPLDLSVNREFEETVSALRRAIVVISLVAVVLAVLVGGILTWAIIQPIRSVTASVERIGGGDYGSRLPGGRDDEFGRLSESINSMAGKVDEAFTTLVATDQMRRDLVTNIGHDLRTPLGGLLGHVEEARRRLDAGESEATLESLESAQRQITFVTSLVEDLFELSLLDSDVPPLRLEPVPVGELVQQAADQQRNLFDASGIPLDLNIQTGLPVVEADGTRLLRLLQNLLDNARNHAPAGTTVSLRAEALTGSVAVEVEDSGAGIDPDDVEHLFDRYYRGNRPRTRKGLGTGLGLAICRAIAEAHGGTLTVASRRGSGTRFTFRMPAARGEAGEKQKGPAA